MTGLYPPPQRRQPRSTPLGSSAAAPTGRHRRRHHSYNRHHLYTLLLLCLGVGLCDADPSISPTGVREAGSDGIRAPGGATITIAGATWSSPSPTAAGNVKAALDGMSGVYAGCASCGTPVKPAGGWTCTFFDKTGSGATAVPARVECVTEDELYDVFRTATYTLAGWVDDGANTWSSTTFQIYPTKGGVAVLGNMSLTLPSALPPATETISEPAAPGYAGGTAVIPSLIFTEEDIAAGGAQVAVVLSGESWNDGVVKAAPASWRSAVAFDTVVNPSTPLNPNGFGTTKGQILPSDAAYRFFSEFHPANGLKDTLQATFSSSDYEIPQHEVVHIVLLEESVQSSAPFGGVPDSTGLSFEIWPVPGFVNFTVVGPLVFTEEQMRMGMVEFELVVSRDTWDVSLDWELFRASLNSDRPTTQEANGWQARRTVFMPDPANIVRVSDTNVKVRLTADPSFDISRIETISFDFPGCSHYRKIRVLPAGTLCTPNYVMKSQLQPITSRVELQILPTAGTISLLPSGMLTECDVRAGVTLTLKLDNELWNSVDIDAAKTRLYNLMVSDVPTSARPAGEPAGFNALKSFLIPGPATTGIMVGAGNTEMYVAIGPSTAYDISQNETINLAEKLMGDSSAAAVLFESGNMASFAEGANGTIVISPGPCHELLLTSSCRQSATCGPASMCVCMEFDELDIREGKAVITLTLPAGEKWNAAASLNVADIVWSSRAADTAAVSGGSTSDKSFGDAANTGYQLPWGFLAKAAASTLVTLARVSDQIVTLTFSNTAYDTHATETVSFTVPSGFVESGVSPVPTVEFKISPVRPTVTPSPNPFEVFGCDMQGPAYGQGGFTSNIATPYTLLRADAVCGSADVALGTAETLLDCAQACFVADGCKYFTYGRDALAKQCTQEKTSAAGCPEGFAVATADFYELPVDAVRFSLSLDIGTWDVTADDIRSAFTPRDSAFVQNLDTLLPHGSILLPSNNTIMLQFAAVPSFSLLDGGEVVHFTVQKSMVSCDCLLNPVVVPLTIKKCPGVVQDVDIVLTERDIWEGTANLTLSITGDEWNETVGWEYLDWLKPHDVPSVTWLRHFDCVFRNLPDRVSPTLLSIPLGPCPAFDINTDNAGALGILALADNTTSYLSVTGALTRSGTAPVGGNQVGFRQSSPYARVYFNISSSEGTVRVANDVQFTEESVRQGLYQVTLQLDVGESFANPMGYDLREYIRTHTRTIVTQQPNGGGWDYLQTVLIRSAEIDPTDPHKLLVTWSPNNGYNIDLPEYLCFEIDQYLTASGLQPKADDGSYCVKPKPILATAGCVRMEPSPYQITEEEMRTSGATFDLILDNSEQWVSVGLDLLIENMTVAHPTTNTLGWNARKSTYSASAFSIDATKSRLTVRIPGSGSGASAPDPLYDIVESELIEIDIPEVLVGSRKPPCVVDPGPSGKLFFNITAVSGSVHMVNSEFTEGDIRTSGATVVVTIVGDRWAEPWGLVQKEAVRANLIPICNFLETPPANGLPQWLEQGHPRQDLRCGHAHGFDTYRSDAMQPLVNMTLLQYNNDRLEVVLNPTPGYDITEDEVVLIRVPTESTATGTFPANWNRMWFIIRADKAVLSNQELRDNNGGLTQDGIITPGIPDEQIRLGTAPPVKIELFYETWDVTEGDRFKKGFCGSGGVCTDVTNPSGFNALRDRVFPATVTFETRAGLQCPPNCPATVAVFKFNAVPEFDVCTGVSEEVYVELDPLTASSHPRTAPTAYGVGAPNVLGFNITGGSAPQALGLKFEKLLTPGGGVYDINEKLIREAGLAITLSVYDGAWNVGNPNFVDQLRASVVSTMPRSEVYSHAGPLLAELMPKTMDEITFYSDTTIPNRHMVFNLSHPEYDIPDKTPKKDCVVSNCPFLNPTTVDNQMQCEDLTSCDVTQPDGFMCCMNNNGIRSCPRNWPYMCEYQTCSGSQFCCVDDVSACNTRGGLRTCGDPGCVQDETLSFDLHPDLTVCRITPSRNELSVRIDGDDWGMHFWNTTAYTYEALNGSRYVDEPIPLHLEGWELHTRNDTAGLSLSPGCTSGDVVQTTAKLSPAAPLIPTSPQGVYRAGPGHYAVMYTPSVSMPGIYDVCYKDFRDAGFTRIPVLGVGQTVYPVLTVIGKAFRIEGDWGDDNNKANVSADTTRIAIHGKGLCVGNVRTNGAGLRTYAHVGVGCDSVKLMFGDVDCNPGQPAQYDDMTGRYGDAEGLMPLDMGDVGGVPRTVGYADFQLRVRGQFSVCYLSKWAVRWQKVDVITVQPSIRRWDACDPRSADADVTVQHFSARHAAHLTPYSKPLCAPAYIALPAKPQRIYFGGFGLTSTQEPLGNRARRRFYTLLGRGGCAPATPTDVIAMCTWDEATTLEGCQIACDISGDCDAVQYRESTQECVLHFSNNDAMYPLFGRQLTCTPDPHTNRAKTRPQSELRAVVDPTQLDTACFLRTADVNDSDVGDAVKVIRYGDDCNTATGPGEDALSPDTPAIQNVTGDPWAWATDWDSNTRTCGQPKTRSHYMCQSFATEAIWTFYAYGRYTFCYRHLGTTEWVIVPDTHLEVRAEVTEILPTQLEATQVPPVITYIGTGFLRGPLEARLREWPADCDTPARHPGVLGYGWEKDALLPPGELLDGFLNQQVGRVLQTNWSFQSVADADGPNTALLPHWWAHSGAYLFCYRVPGMGGQWLPIDYVTVVPRLDAFSPGQLLAAPSPQSVRAHGEGLDSRRGKDMVKFVPAVMGTCDSHPEGDFIVYTVQLEPKQGGLGSQGEGVRGLTAVTSAGQTFGVAATYHVCYGTQNVTAEAMDMGSRQCSSFPACAAFSGACCPDDNGLWNDCCQRQDSTVWRALPTQEACPPTPQYPSTWPDWFIGRQANCVPALDVSQRQDTWDDKLDPPCPDFYCNKLQVYPLIGSLVVEDHTTPRDPPLLEVDVAYRIRFDGQGFSRGDPVYWLKGFRSGCEEVVPQTTPSSRLLPVDASPGTPWQGNGTGLPRAYYNARFAESGDYTLCLGFQYFPGLYIAAGNVSVENAVATMRWDVVPLGTLDITFEGGGLSASIDEAMLVPSRGTGAQCDISNAVATTKTRPPFSDAMGSTLWQIPADSLAHGAYQTCYKLGGSDRGWALLSGLIQVPYGNIQPGFDIVASQSDFGPRDNLHFYGPKGMGLQYSAPFATAITAALGDNGENLEWLPREKEQKKTFGFVYRTGSKDFFAGKCVSRRDACLKLPVYADKALCGAAGCSWVEAESQCRPPDLDGCRLFLTEVQCSQTSCRWFAGQEPAIDPSTGYLSFAVGDAEATGSVTLRVTLHDSGGTERGGVNFSEPRDLRITITNGPEFTPVSTTITLREDQPAFNRTVLSWAVSRIRGRQYAFSTKWDLPDAEATYFAGGFIVRNTGALDAVPSPDRYTTGLGATITLRDVTVGVSYSQKFQIVIESVNDPPFFEVQDNMREVLWWRQGRTAPHSAQVTEWPSGTACRTVQTSVCSRDFVARGCTAVSTTLEHDCSGAQVQSCASQACTATSSAVCSALQPSLQACVVSYIESGCMGDPPCGEGNNCAQVACLAAPNSTLTLGNFENTQEVLSFTATVPPSNESSFIALPTITTDGVLSFALSGAALGTFEISLTMKDNGGTSTGGLDTFTSPTRFIVKTFFAPALRVTPTFGGVALQTQFKMEAVGSASDQSGTEWDYAFTTLLNTQESPVNLAATNAISHSMMGPHRSPVVFTRDLPAGKHTVVLRIYQGTQLIDTAHAFISVDAPTSEMLAGALDTATGRASNGTEVMPLLAAVGASTSAVAGSSTAGVARTIVGAINNAANGLQPGTSGAVHGNSITTALTALSNAMVAEVDPETLLLANDAFTNIHAKAGGGGIVTGVTTLQGMSLVGFTDQDLRLLSAAVQQDMETSFSVSPGSVVVGLTQTPEGLVEAKYSVSGRPDQITGIHASVSSTNNERSLSTITTQQVYSQLRANSPVVDYGTSTASASASGTLAVTGQSFRGLTDAQRQLHTDNVRQDLARSFGMPADLISVSLLDDNGKSVVKFTANTRGNASYTRGVQCALIPACGSTALAFPTAQLEPDLAGSSATHAASGRVVLKDVDLGALLPDKAAAVKDALLSDLAAAYGVPSSSLTLGYSTTSGQGTAVSVTVNTTGLSDPGVVQNRLVQQLDTQTLDLPRTREALKLQTAVGVRYDLSSANIVRGKPVDTSLMPSFLSASSAMLGAAPRGPSAWRTSADVDALSTNSTERQRINYAVNQQMDALYAIIDSNCEELLSQALATRKDSPPFRSSENAFSAEWLAVLGATVPVLTGIVTSEHMTTSGPVSVTTNRPSVDTCIATLVFNQSPFVSDGRPKYHPLGPVSAVRGRSLDSTSVTLPQMSADINVIAWRRSSQEWGEVSGGSVGSTSDSKPILTWPSGGEWLRKLQQSTSPQVEHIMAASVRSSENSSKCLPCVVLPTVIGLWLLLVIVGVVLHRKFLRIDEPMDDAAKLMYTIDRKPTLALSCFKHHAWLCYFVPQPMLVQFYLRAERATVWFVPYFIGVGVVSAFYSPDAVPNWSDPPEVKYGECVLIGLLSMFVGWVPSLGLRHLLASRQRYWRCHADKADVHIPSKYKDKRQDDIGMTTNGEQPWWRLLYYAAVAGGCIAMMIMHVVWTGDYNTGEQIERWTFSFVILIACHFLFEFLWMSLMHKFERDYWESKDHPRDMTGVSQQYDDDKKYPDQPSLHKPLSWGNDDDLRHRTALSERANMTTQNSARQYEEERIDLLRGREEEEEELESPKYFGADQFEDRRYTAAPSSSTPTKQAPFSAPPVHSVIDWDAVRAHSPTNREQSYQNIGSFPVPPSEHASHRRHGDRYGNPDSSPGALPGGRGRGFAPQPSSSGYGYDHDQRDPLLVTSTKHPLAAPPVNQSHSQRQLPRSFNQPPPPPGMRRGGSPDSDDPYDFFDHQEEQLRSFQY